MKNSNNPDRKSLGFPKVTLYSTSESGYASMFFGGLQDLSQKGRLRLSYAHNSALRLPRELEHCALWIKIEWQETAGIASKLLFIDLQDDAAFPSLELMRASDLYCKRSFEPESIAKLPLDQQSKVLRAPLSYPVRGKYQTVYPRILRALLASDWKSTPFRSVRRTLLAPWRELPFSNLMGLNQLPPRVTDLEQNPTREVQKGVYFRTRLYDLSATNDEVVRQKLSLLNDSRIELIRTLREALGSAAFAGLYPNSGSAKHCPELVIDLPPGYADADGHLRYSRQFLVNVNSVGVAESNGWKIAEILAAGTCLVTEALAHETINPLQSGVHMEEFATAAECVEKCKQLLEDPARAAQLRVAGHKYFQDKLRPENAVAELLQEAYRTNRKN